ncbi:MauE/DoxX family redox-associated membrane protein [Catellatospora sp. NPDC049609]|uniref:DoxX family protein n=1 Tax=Catellatospora sp. NPDC049609 TaxID=3155505 RepID=UPI00343AEA2E
MTWHRAQPWVSLACRLGLAGIFIVAGALKVTDLASSGRAVNAYQIMPYDLAMVVGAAQPFVEIVVGLLLLFGLATRLAAWASAVMMVAFIAGIASAWSRGLNIDCGCFSKGGPLPPGVTPNYLPDIIRDVAFLAMAIFLIIYPVSRFSLDARLDRPSPALEDDVLEEENSDEPSEQAVRRRERL